MVFPKINSASQSRRGKSRLGKKIFSTAAAAAGVFGGVILAGTPKAEAINYNFTALGFLYSGASYNRTYSNAFGINDSGVVVGTSGAYSISQETYFNNAFSYSGGAMTNLGALPGRNFSNAAGINDSGTVVGTSENLAFSYTTAGGMIDLGTLPGGSSSYAFGINDSGVVVGEAGTSAGYLHAFTYTSTGGMTDLGTLPGYTSSSATSINSSGTVVGQSYASSGPTHAFSYTSGGGMVDLGTLPGGSSSYAFGVNDSGTVVGYAVTSSGAYHAFSYTTAGGMKDLGTLGGSTSYANGINDSGTIVGDSGISSGGYDAYVDINGTMIDLNSLTTNLPAGWTLNDATAINAAGDIVGYGTNASDYSEAFLLTPIMPTLYWNNAAGNRMWDISTSSNWNDVTDAIDPAQYADGDNVIFDDAHNTSGNYNVTLNTTVNPGSVTVNNAAGNYVISGTGSIGGTTNLVKEGAGSLTLATVNTYSGGTTVTGGTLIGGATDAFGSGGLTVNAGAVQLGGHNQTVAFLQGSGGAITDSAPFSATLTFGSGYGSYTFSGSISDGGGIGIIAGNNGNRAPITFPSIHGSLSLMDNNAGLQILNGPLSYTGTTTINGGGTLQISGANTETLTGAISGGGNLTVGDGSYSTNLTLTGALGYTGSTMVAGASALVLGSEATIASPYIHVESGGTFDVSQVNGGFVLGGSTHQVLYGTGTVRGDLIVAPAGALTPGEMFGVLTVDGNVTLQGTFAALVDPLEEENPPNSELITGDSGNVVLGGNLEVTSPSFVFLGSQESSNTLTNPGIGTPPFSNGESYTLINAAGGIQNGSGVQAAFSSVTLPAPGAGLSWDTTMMNDNPSNYQNNYTISIVNSVPTGFTLGAPLYSAALTPGQSYSGYYIKNLGGRGTDVQFLDGTVSTSTSLAVQFSNAPADATHLISDYVTVNGTNSDTYVLELNYTSAQLGSFEPTSPVLAVDSGGLLKTAVLLNSGGTAHEILGAYNSGADFVLGDYGVDTTNDVVWAVLNYSAGDKFGVASRLVGDAAGTGIVTPQDISIVLSNQGDATNLWSLGDFNDTNSVTPQDISQVLAAQGNTATGSSIGGMGSITSSPSDDKVPEPGSLALLAIGGMSLLIRRRCKNVA